MLCFLVLIILVFFAVRLATDIPNLSSGRDIDQSEFESRYAAHPFIAYAHIVPGVLFLFGALHQLSARFRRRSLRRHRTVGRLLVVAGVTSAVFAIVFGLAYPYGGVAEQTAAVAFGGYLAIALVRAFVAARRHDARTHRRWMIRAVAVASGVASIRIVIGASEATGLASFNDVFGPAFWIALTAHAVIAEIWLHPNSSLVAADDHLAAR